MTIHDLACECYALATGACASVASDVRIARIEAAIRECLPAIMAARADKNLQN